MNQCPRSRYQLPRLQCMDVLAYTTWMFTESFSCINIIQNNWNWIKWFFMFLKNCLSLTLKKFCFLKITMCFSPLHPQTLLCREYHWVVFHRQAEAFSVIREPVLKSKIHSHHQLCKPEVKVGTQNLRNFEILIILTYTKVLKHIWSNSSVNKSKNLQGINGKLFLKTS